jgi:hypothetical protein
MNEPCCTVRARTTAELKVSVSVTVESRDTPLIEIGTV